VTERKDSGFSAEGSSEEAVDAAAPKTKDFALCDKRTNARMKIDTQTPVAAVTGKDGGVWRRLRIKAFIRHV